MLTPTVGAYYGVLERRLGLSNAGVSGGGMMAFLNYGGFVNGMPVGANGSSGNAAPIAEADTFETPAGVVLHVPAPGVLANDHDPEAQAVTAIAATGATAGGGSFTLFANGAFSYTPPTTNPGATDTFKYRATDGTNLSTEATVTVNLKIPTPPVLALIDDFNGGDGPLKAGWVQRVTTNALENIQVRGQQATAVGTDAGGLVIWDTDLAFDAIQGASMQLGSNADKSALILKASGGTQHVAPANYVRVRADQGNGKIVIETMQGSGGAAQYVKHALIPAAGLASSALSAVVDDKAVVTVFLNGAYVGGVQLPDVAAWKGTGRIGFQLQTLNATADDFAGGNL